MKKTKAIFFDFDGTIFNLATDWDEVRRKMVKLFQKYKVESNFRPLFGEIVRLLDELAKKGIEKNELKRIEKKINRLIENGEEKGVRRGKLVRGIEDCFDSLKKDKISIAILSRNSRRVIEKVIRQFDLPQPNMIIGREEIGFKKLKPHPLAGIIALEQLGLKKEEVLFIGDSFNDLQFGQNLGVKVVLLKSPRLSSVPKKAELVANLFEFRKQIN